MEFKKHHQREKVCLVHTGPQVCLSKFAGPGRWEARCGHEQTHLGERIARRWQQGIVLRVEP